MTVHDHAYTLARALKAAEEYRQYHEHLNSLDETARQMLQEFRLVEARLQLNHLSGEEPPADAVSQRERLGELIGLHRPILEFIAAEQRLMVLIQDVQRILGEALDLWDYDLKKE